MHCGGKFIASGMRSLRLGAVLKGLTGFLDGEPVSQNREMGHPAGGGLA